MASDSGPGAGGAWTEERREHSDRSDEGRRHIKDSGTRASEGERQLHGPGSAAEAPTSAEAGAPAAPAPNSALGSAPEPRFRRWRRTRPFWGGLLILLAGVEILITMIAPLSVVLHIGLQGLAGYLMPIVLILCGLLLWFSPDQRLFYAILAVICSLASWITSNLGGFVVGVLLGLVGGSLAFAWAPDVRLARARHHKQ